MDVTKKTPRRNITIQSAEFSVPAPYAEGHTLTVNEAAVLNQVLAENIRNNSAKTIASMKEAGKTAEEMQAAVDEYIAGYEFGVKRSGGGRTTDPVRAKAIELATKKVKDALLAKGSKLKDVGNDRIRELAIKAVEQHPVLMEQASQIVEMHRKAVGDVEVSVEG